MILVPDYVSPVIAWRVWQLAEGGLKSLNGEPWLPGEPLTARCAGPALAGPMLRGAYPRHGAAEVPALKCSCGVYATSSFSFLRRMEYERYGIKGEVYLWGKVVEHENGWRAQFAYHKSLLLSADRLPATLARGEIPAGKSGHLPSGYSCCWAPGQHSSVERHLRLPGRRARVADRSRAAVLSAATAGTQPGSRRPRRYCGFGYGDRYRRG